MNHIALAAHIEQQRIDLLFQNARAYSESAVIMVACMVLVLAPSVAWDDLLIWAAAVITPQGFIQWLRWRYQQRPHDADAREWGWRYAITLLISGIAWGSGIFLLFVPEQPTLQALVAMCLAGRATASMLGLAYFPPALYTFALPIFLALMLKYLLLGTAGSVATSMLWLVFVGYLLLLGHRQARTIVESIQVRDENRQLVQELQRKNEAEAQARIAAEQASLAKTRFFAAANHDLRQPLHSLGLFAHALRESDSEPVRRKAIDEIFICIESLQALFDELLDLSRLDAGQITVKREHFPVQALFDRIHSSFAAQARDKNLQLRIRASSLYVHSDATLLFRILSNLVSNAIRYTRDGGLLVAARQRRGAVELLVCDTGIGIPAHEQQSIFEEFYQLDNAERDRRKGLGLGLATVKRVSELLGHPLALRSVVGRGTVLRLQLPLGDQAQQQIVTQEATTSTNLVAGKLVLVIDDEAAVRDGTATVLTGWGCRAVTASDAAEALSKLNDGERPDFLLVDLRLRQQQTGIAAIAQLRQHFAMPIPAILITGDSNAERLREAAAQQLSVVHKPLAPVRLRALLNQTFRQL